MPVVRLPLWEKTDPWYKRVWRRAAFDFFLWRYHHGLLTKAEHEDILDQCRHDAEERGIPFEWPRQKESLADYINSLDLPN